MQSAIILNFVVACSLFQYGTTLTCYNCDTTKDISCKFGLLSLSFPSEECKANTGSSILDNLIKGFPTNCIKLVGIDKYGDTHVARGCTANFGFNACNMAAKTISFLDGDVRDMGCFTCNTDDCNGTTRNVLAAPVAVLLATCVVMFIL